MDLWIALRDVLVLLMAALMLGVISERLRQSPILGYLLAGTLLGPHALNVVSSEEEVKTLAELGVALLLFTIGLEFSWRRLRRMGAAAFGGGVVQVVATLVFSGAIAVLFGQSLPAAFTIGAVIALSSTATVLRILLDRAEVDSMHGRSALGVLLLQDLAVVPLVLIVDLLAREGSASDVAIGAARALLLGLLLIGGFYLLFNKFVPRVLGTLAARRSRELPVLMAILVGFGSAFAAHELDLSPALGAFVAGLLLADSPYATQIRADVSSMRTLLVTLFFVSIGMFGDPRWIAAHLVLVLAVVVAVIAGKAIIVWLVLRLVRQSPAHALSAGICLAQIGEFSFVIAVTAQDRIISDDVFKLMVSVTIGTLFVTPYLVAKAPRLALKIVSAVRRLAGRSAPVALAARDDEGLRDHVIIVGFGPAGQAVGESLYGRGHRVVVVDLSRRVLEAARRLDFEAHLGDALQVDVLEHLHAARAAAVVVTVPDAAVARDIARQVRVKAPNACILVRSRYHVYRWEIEFAGADVVIDEEQQVGVRLAVELRRRLRARLKAPE